MFIDIYFLVLNIRFCDSQFHDSISQLKLITMMKDIPIL